MTRILPNRLLLAWIAAAVLSPSALAQTLFFEDFQTRIDPGTGQPVLRCSGPGGAGTYPFPETWLLRNVDNFTPATTVAYVNEAWEVREDFTGDLSDCVAFSTSFYVPAGRANDWMWTPAIGPLPEGTTRLSWQAKAYDPQFPDGYEVRVMDAAGGPPTGATGNPGNQITNSTVVFSTAAESSTWTNRSVDIDAVAVAGQTIYIGFRNPSNDQFILVIDDIKVESVRQFDPQLLAVEENPAQGWSTVPSWLALGFDLQAQVRNSGLAPLTGVTVEADVLVDGVVVDSLTSDTIPVLAPGASQPLAVGDSAYTDPGSWTVEAQVLATEGDDLPANSTLTVELIEVTGNEIRRAQGAATEILGIGAGTGGELGHDFDLPVASKLAGARFVIDNVDLRPDPGGDGIGDFNGYTLQSQVRSWNAVDDEPGDVIATASTVVPAGTPLGPFTLAFDFPAQVLPPGRYLFSLVEPTAPQPITLTLRTMPQRYTPGTTWAIWPQNGGWSTLESFGPTFRRALDVSAVLEQPVTVPLAVPDAFQVPHLDTFAGDVALNDTTSDDGGNVWSVTQAPAAGTLLMQPTGAFEYIPAPASVGSTLTFEYELCDVDDDCSTAVVELSIVLSDPIFADDFE